MKTRALSALAALLFVCLPALAAGNACLAIRTLAVPDVQTGESVTISWSYDGGLPQSQTLSGHDFAEAIPLPPGQTSYTYLPTQPGEKHVQLTAVSSCGTVTRTAKYQVKRCSVAEPTLTVDRTAVLAGETIHASVDLPPGHTARWEVRNGTASSAGGSAISIVAGATGPVEIDVFVSRGNSCTVKVSASVAVESPCAITAPVMSHPDHATPNNYFFLYTPLAAGQTATFVPHGAEVISIEPQLIAVTAPATGSFSIDVTIDNGSCSRTFTKTFQVLPCNPTATISAGTSTACGTTLVAEFTGDGPFQGEWSDNEYFFTFDNRIERSVTTSGNYTLLWFADRYCDGAISGSVAVQGGALPQPVFTVDEMANGGWYGNATCPGLARIARVNVPIPAGAAVTWTVENGAILSGQGTPVLEFAGTTPGPITISAVVTKDACTSAAYSYPYVETQGDPYGTISIEPSTIPAGGTAVVTVTTNRSVVGFGVESSNGDQLVWLGQSGERTFQYEYRSSQGAGQSTVTFSMSNACGASYSTSANLTIEAGEPVGATATVRALGSGCDSFVFVEFTGTAPFTGTWSNGDPFNVSEPYAYLFPASGGTYTITAFHDANGAGTVTGSATLTYSELPTPQFTFSPAASCPGEIVTATLTTPLPEGGSANWMVSIGEIVAGQGTASVQIRSSYSFHLSVDVAAPNACSPQSPWVQHEVTSAQPQAPLFDVYQGVYAGGSMQFDVHLDTNIVAWGYDNSFGDTMEVIANPQPNVYTIRYTSTHGAGTTTVRVWSTNSCGVTLETTRTMNVVGPPPTATMTSVPGPTCGATITVTFSGTAPFTGMWENGETFSTSDASITRFVPASGNYAIYDFRDAVAAGDSVGAWVETTPFYQYVNASFPYDSCGAPVTVEASDVPAGFQVLWSIDPLDNSAGAQIVSGQGTPQVVIETATGGDYAVSVRYRTPEGCDGPSWGTRVKASTSLTAPELVVPTTSINAGDSFEFTVRFAEASYTDLFWETSNGDWIEFVGWDNGTYTLRYVSVNGAGTSTIRAFGRTMCGYEAQSTATITIH